jgi:predicted metal-dependent phosphotriesterase family hydrolase
MNRRHFLQTALAGTIVANQHRCLPAADSLEGQVITVTGPVDPNSLGVTLPHEHVMVDFIGADKVNSDRYDHDQVYEAVLPHLKQLRQAGCQSFVDCTPTYLARDPQLLKRLSEASGLHILTNTGYYGARQGKYLPKHALEESADQLAERWLAEWKVGINSTEIRPGFIKIGVDGGRLTDVNRKLVQAAARTHLQSGLTIACHTGDGVAAMEEMEILRAEGLDPSAWIWVHAQNERDQALHERAAARGGWVEFDGIGPDSIDRHIELVSRMKDRGLLGRVLISHDAGWYSVGEPGGGTFRPYTTLFERFIPALEKAGFTDGEIRRLTVDNPAEAFTIRVRRLKG